MVKWNSTPDFTVSNGESKLFRGKPISDFTLALLSVLAISSRYSSSYILGVILPNYAILCLEALGAIVLVSMLSSRIAASISQGKSPRKWGRSEEEMKPLASYQREMHVDITPTVRPDNFARAVSPRRSRSYTKKETSSSPYTSLTRKATSSTPEQLQKIIQDFDDGTNQANSMITKEGNGFAVQSTMGEHLSARNTYRPSAVPRGAVSTPMRTDGRVVQSLLSQRDAVLADLGIDEEILDRSVELLREWFACRVLQPLHGAISKAHSDVMETCARLGLCGVKLTDLNDLGAESSSKVADDSLNLNQIRSRLEEVMRSLSSAQIDDYRACMQAIINYQKLLLLLRGEFLPNLLPPVADRYVLSRIKDLANGSCMIDFRWNGGGEYNGKHWSPEMPTDSALVLYLFACYLAVPSWKFSDQDQSVIEGSGEVLYLGRLPPRVKGQFVAILATRIPQGAKGTSVQGLKLGTTSPHFSVSYEGETRLTETDQLGLFRILVIYLYYVYRHGNMLGSCSFEYLRLDSVVHAKKRLHFIENLRRLHLW